MQTSPQLSLKGRTALITGSTSGIGLGMAKGLAAQGANIVINGLGDAGEIEKARKDVEGLGVRCVYDGADMTKPAQITAMVEKAIKDFGKIDILVNNAGFQHVAPIEEFPPEKWDAMIAIILSSAFHTTRAAVPTMKKNKWGRIINLASAHALVASPFKAAYVSAKHGLLGFTKTMGVELAQSGITCNAICPGYVHTKLVDNQIAATAKARGMSEEDVVNNVLLAAQWTKKFVTVEQIAALAVFLCSDAAENITGAALPIDGGWTAA
ncbi:MAG TPA: 3-hydroxybutyrate dehydrogenase [Alphaproteobacteria bacterium]|nr:3-hydroxybutyrate dehydrogenase [Micavibrio sp.]MBK9562639.1 3-hydroxybutyrate dehydrogenase [Micavibrio sp.]HQX26340.1 3-hydroxybutyrate dehydrogenase [Alphaproteobacteria bacterium]